MSTVEPIRKLEDIKKIENYFKAKGNDRDLLFFNLGINWGLRVSDIVSLDVKDVKNKVFVEVIEQKTGKHKKMFVNKKLKPMIKSYVAKKNPEKPLFETIFGNRLDRFAVYHILKDVCKAVGIEEKIGTHTLRKTFGYHHYKKFKDIVLLQKIFNHTSSSITQRYIGIEQDDIDNSYKNFIL